MRRFLTFWFRFCFLYLAKYAERLVNLGYKVGQVDQTETPAMLQEANAKLPKGEKKRRREREREERYAPRLVPDLHHSFLVVSFLSGVKKRQAVNREISSVLTPGTLVDGDVLGSADANYLLSLTESLLPHEEVAAARGRLEQALASGVTTEAEKARLEDEANEVVEIGFTWVDCTTGQKGKLETISMGVRWFVCFFILLTPLSPHPLVPPFLFSSRSFHHWSAS